MPVFHDPEDRVGSVNTLRNEFIYGAARAFWATAWAEYIEEQGERSLSGVDVLEAAPPAPPEAYALAGELWAGLEALNKSNAPAGVYSLANQALKADGLDPDSNNIDGCDFGHYMAMQAMGTGACWSDNHACFLVHVPRIECSSLTFSDEYYESVEED